MKVLITGGCGFIGVNLVPALLSGGIRHLRVLDDLSVGTREDLEGVLIEAGDFSAEEKDAGTVYTLGRTGAVCELIVGDILDAELALSACDGVSALVHLAANTGVLPSIEDPVKDCMANVIGTLNLLEGARRNNVERFVFASSGAPLGEQVPPINEEKVPKPLSPYGASKLAGEGYCMAYYGSFGLKTVVLRFGNAYGPRSQRKSSVVARFFKRAMSGERLEIYGEGNQTRDFIFVEDIVSAIIKSLSSDVAGEVFQIATHRETTVNELAEKVAELVERDTNVEVEVVKTTPNKGEMERSYSDITKARDVLGFEPAYDLDRGLKETWAWFKR